MVVEFDDAEGDFGLPFKSGQFFSYKLVSQIHGDHLLMVLCVWYLFLTKLSLSLYHFFKMHPTLVKDVAHVSENGLETDDSIFEDGV